jgi:GDP-mannose 6-dehydrogenase
MRGHNVIGVDSNAAKTGLINQRQAPIVEKDVGGIVGRAVEAGSLRATTNSEEAVLESDISIVCVGTPALSNGRLDTRAVEKVSHEIGAAIARKSTPHCVVIRSTMLPGTFRDLVLPVLASSSNKRAGQGFTAAINPEFLREGSAVADFLHPEKTVIGSDDADTGDVVASLYDGLPGEFVQTTPELAQFSKYIDNSWHAVKVSFANEIGNLCKALGIDSHAAMHMMTMDTKLNTSAAYLKPGFAFGGSCLPKDTRALNYFARTMDLNLPLLQSIMPSNAQQIERACDWVLSHGKKRITLLGCLQGRYRRHAREPVHPSDGTVARQGLLRSHFRQECEYVDADGRQPRLCNGRHSAYREPIRRLDGGCPKGRGHRADDGILAGLSPSL